MRNIILEQGVEALILRTDYAVIRSLPYDSISGISLKGGFEFQGAKVGSDFFVIVSDGAEVKVDYDKILSPVTATAQDMLNTLIGWCYTLPTAAPTTAATTAATTAPVPDYVYPIYWLDNQFAVADYIWLNSSAGNVTAILASASSFKIINTVNNNLSFVAADILALDFLSSRTRISMPSTFLNSQEFIGQLEVYL